MINLMYLVLLAMLALNVSTDVLEGFSLVADGLKKSTENASKMNLGIYSTFEEQMKSNPAKVKEWYEKAQYVRGMSDSLYNLAEELKEAIVRKSDGKDADINDIRNREDLEASTQVMLAPGTGRGKELYNAINSYRERILKMVTDKDKRELITSNFDTEVPAKGKILGKNWQEYSFENMPTVAAVTLLTKLQSDVRDAEGEVLHNLVSNIDVKDIRVNQLNAYVIPVSQTVVQGGRFSAQIIMAAVDTTRRPTIYIGGQQIKSDTLYTNSFSYPVKEGDFFSISVRSFTRTGGDGSQYRYSAYSDPVWLFAQPMIKSVNYGSNYKVSITNGRLKLRWKPVAGVSGYRVYASTERDSGYKLLAELSGKKTKEYTAARFVKKKWKPKKTYYIYVEAVYYAKDGTYGSSGVNYVWKVTDGNKASQTYYHGAY